MASAISLVISAIFNGGWDPARIPTPAFALTNNNRTMTRNSGTGWATGYAVGALSNSQKSVWEVTLENSGYNITGFSTTAPATGWTSNYIGSISGSAGFYWSPGQAGVVMGTGVTATVSSIGECIVGDTLAFGWDPIAGTIKVWKNGVALNSGNPIFTGLAGKTITPANSLYNPGASSSINGSVLRYSYPGYSS